MVVTMGLFPSHKALNEIFSSPQVSRHPEPEPQRSKIPKPTFSVWSVAEDARSKATALSAEAKAEISKASSTAQAKAGTIELYSAKYYAACTFGGLIACVGYTEKLAQGE